MLSVVNINQKFDNHSLFENSASLYIKENEVVLLYGDNGGGKSSILEIMSYITKPTSGEVYWDDKKIKSAKEANKIRADYMSIMFSDFRFLRQLSIYENITLPNILSGRDNFQDQYEFLMDDLLNFTGCSNPNLSLKHLVEKENICKLSDGEKKVIAIARALLLKSPYLLADEMLNGFTEEAKIEIWTRLLNYFKSEKMGVFLIEHWAKAKEIAAGTGAQLHSYKLSHRNLIKE